jgi:predicted nucleic-acid-binding protein
MRGLDSNVLLRVLTTDDPAQAERVKRAFQDAREKEEPLFVSVIVLCELVWTLRGKPYALDREALSNLVTRLLDDGLFEIQDRGVVQQALKDYRQGRGDFADYLLGWKNRDAGCRDTLTFDGKLREHEVFTLLE